MKTGFAAVDIGHFAVQRLSDALREDVCGDKPWAQFETGEFRGYAGIGGDDEGLVGLGYEDAEEQDGEGGVHASGTGLVGSAVG